MVAPLTQHEIDGGFTPHADEGAFLDQIAADTTAIHTVAGTSAQGREIHRLDVGSAAPTAGTLLIVTGQHGNEKSPREGVLAFARDLAYSTDPAITGYLSTHRVVFITGANPDGLVANTRNVTVGGDMNRQHYMLTPVESQALTGVFRDVDPVVSVDCHGRDDINGVIDWEGNGTAVQAAHPDIRALAATLQAKVRADLATEGYTSRDYLPGPIRRGLDAGAGAHHGVGLLCETWRGSVADRVNVLAAVLTIVCQWHEDNAAALLAAKSASKATATTNAGEYVLEYGGNHIHESTSLTYYVPPDGYQLATGQSIPPRITAGFGVTADGSGFITMAQEARWVIPLLFDPLSTDKVSTASVVGGNSTPPEPPPPPRDLLPGGLRSFAGSRVRLDGKTYEVVAMRIGPNGPTVPLV